MNNYFNYPDVRFSAGKLARGITVDQQFGLIAEAFDAIEAEYGLDGVIAAKTWVNERIAAEVALGGSPGDIPITNLGVGTLNEGEVLTREDGALAGLNIRLMKTQSATAAFQNSIGV